MFSNYRPVCIPRNVFGGAGAAVCTALSIVGFAFVTGTVHAGERHAAGAAVVVHEAVRYHDLDLTHRDHARELYQRLQRAARRVCRDEYRPTMRALAARRACYENALASAVADVDHVSLATLHRRDGHTSAAQRRGS